MRHALNTQDPTIIWNANKFAELKISQTFFKNYSSS